ncbi:M28 family metallopeptidase [Alteromonas sp. McT4-15]|uniref:M28 family metallopeptidase n=1 Tax=Alteromonas sp. McT4-15 TaxID=2881256 RepID=UPI001CF89944|nr:M28 family metallopeptidase [Alteromonas sp. McT4-15]MCB4435048.1 M28 family metallopeptidase [Alteromonas sp. McT4-15]
MLLKANLRIFLLTVATALVSSANANELNIDLETYRTHAKTLASDEFEGRGPLSKGEEKTVAYLTKTFEKLGLKPAFGDSYTQAVPLAKITPTHMSSLKMGNLEFSAGTEFTARTQRIADSYALNNSDVIFVGYGIYAPEYNWNDYAGLDVKGKTVVMLVNDPGFASKDPALFQGNAMTYYGRWTYKYEEAARQGAEAVFIVHETMPAGYGWGVVENSNSNTKFALVDDNNNASQVGVMGWLHLNAARALFESAGLSYSELKAKASKPGFTAIPLNTKATLSFDNQIAHAESQNVAGILPGNEASDEWVMLHAHWDHLGKVEKNGKTTIYNGAVDNASGVAGVLTLAQSFVEKSKQEGTKRTLMFSAFTAEETGLLGADYFANNPPIDTANMVAFLNIDGMNVNDEVDYILQYGEGYLSIEDDLKQAAQLQGRKVKMDPRPQNGLFFRSDHFALAKQGVPSILFMSLGDTDPSFIAKRYHKADDDYLPTWTLGGVAQDMALISSMMIKYANSNEWPYWKRESDFKAKREKALKQAKRVTTAVK